MEVWFLVTVAAVVLLAIFIGLIVLVCFLVGWLREKSLDNERYRGPHNPAAEALLKAAQPQQGSDPLSWMKVYFPCQPIDDQGTPFCANIECGLPLETPFHFIEMMAPGNTVITRIFCPECQARLMEERRAVFCS